MIARRDCETIVIAHRMDPGRRELYVEGRKDLLFFKWITQSGSINSALVIEIDEVDSPPEVMGNNRLRMIHFAKQVGAKVPSIRCFADADYDRLFGQPLASELTYTDHRDLEGYLITTECFDKLLMLGAGMDVDPRVFLEEICSAARDASLVRIVSQRQHLSLPFQYTLLAKYLDVSRTDVSCDVRKYSTALFQNAGISLAGLDAFLGSWEQERGRLKKEKHVDIVHGKDLFAVLQKVLETRTAKENKVSAEALWTTFERGMCASYSNLLSIVEFMRV